MRLIILTLNWNAANKITNLKNSLIKAVENVKIPVEWYIRDNAGKDTDLIKSWNLPFIKLMSVDHNRANYSQGMNSLFEMSEAKDNDIILTLNNDVLFQDNLSLPKMIDILLRDKNIGQLGAKLNYNNTNKIQHNGVLYHSNNGLPFHYREHVEQEDKYDRRNREFPIVSGALTMLKADVFKRAGMYPENLQWCWDDCWLSLAIHHELGLKVVCVGDTDIWHESSASLKQNPVNKLFFNSNYNTFVSKWKKYLDKSLLKKYQNDPEYGIYHFKS